MDNQYRELRAKSIGILLLDLRLSLQKSIVEMARGFNVSPRIYRDYEAGSKSPSLPELELISLYFKIPVDHFFGRTLSSSQERGDQSQIAMRIRRLRDRIIGIRLCLARIQSEISIHEISKRLSIPIDKINKYETGELPIPIPELELYANEVGLILSDLFDTQGTFGKSRLQQLRINNFIELPDSIQSFICEKRNVPYLELAMRISEFSCEKLNKIADSIYQLSK